ncbi:hypothetical protein MKX34_11560 [Paenibacillus sp. FSL R5-0636]|uniref:Uncharacterized protein n=1 Tax=Paenibacillus odorifer TaxID=189426 RepID=A0AB36J988_9BACL|nr:hypothetical protein [Paenibacillus odorifer]OMD04698.1 hypothetical protein BJP49_22775 [Paenibacillus odorifer]OME09607.1 hypothetical protein BSK60_27625 [Paenibacillus odorifer]OME10414.1 hypothetical protein BSK47_30785 [Paenibacillus odorifer]
MDNKKSRYPDMTTIFQNCLNRGCTPEQIQDFTDRTRRNWLNNPSMLALIDDLEVRYITSLGEGKEV